MSPQRRHNRSMTICTWCGIILEGRQRKFCSRGCKNRDSNSRHQSYSAQQRRGRSRKIRLIQLSGTKCIRCGYNTNFSALQFHHVVPCDKTFNLDLRSLSNRSWTAIIEESRKCILLCSNCHKEEHNPECRLSGQKSLHQEVST